MHRGRFRGVEHCCFHITHRCQERRFLLKFEIDRRNYLKRLREAAGKHDVKVLCWFSGNRNADRTDRFEPGQLLVLVFNGIGGNV